MGLQRSSRLPVVQRRDESPAEPSGECADEYRFRGYLQAGVADKKTVLTDAGADGNIMKIYLPRLILRSGPISAFYMKISSKTPLS